MIRRPPRSTPFLHDALPISGVVVDPVVQLLAAEDERRPHRGPAVERPGSLEDEDAVAEHLGPDLQPAACEDARDRSEEHTSELQSRRDIVCRLLLEKKKQTE